MVVSMAWIIIGLTLDEIQDMVLWDDEEKKKKELGDFCQPFTIHPVYAISPCSFPDSGAFYDILNLADVTDVFVVNSILQSVASDSL